MAYLFELINDFVIFTPKLLVADAGDSGSNYRVYLGFCCGNCLLQTQEASSLILLI